MSKPATRSELAAMLDQRDALEAGLHLSSLFDALLGDDRVSGEHDFRLACAEIRRLQARIVELEAGGALAQ